MYRVFIVDDEPPFVRQIAKILSLAHSSFQVVGTAYNGREALDKLRVAGADLLITDAKMPVIDGPELIAEARAMYPDLQCIIVSGYADFAYAQKGLKVGARDYVLKPIEIEELTRAVLSAREHIDAMRAEDAEHVMDAIVTGRADDAARLAHRVPPGPYLGAMVLDGWFRDMATLDLIERSRFPLEGLLGANAEMYVEPVSSNLWFALMPNPPEIDNRALFEMLLRENADVTVVFSRRERALEDVCYSVGTLLRRVAAYALVSGPWVDGAENDVGDARVDMWIETFSRVIASGKVESFMENFDLMVRKWRQDRVRQRDAVDAIFAILRMLNEWFGKNLPYNPMIEFRDLISQLTTFDEICASLRVYADDAFRSVGAQSVGDKELFARVEEYVRKSLDNPLPSRRLVRLRTYPSPCSAASCGQKQACLSTNTSRPCAWKRRGS